MPRISVNEYNEYILQHITDPSLISLIDKLEFFVKELRNTLLENYKQFMTEFTNAYLKR